MKRSLWSGMNREQTLSRRRAGRKTVSHGSYRAKRKPNSPKVRNAPKRK